MTRSLSVGWDGKILRGVVFWAVATVLLTALAGLSIAQSMYDDGKGHATLLLPGDGLVGINTGDASLQVGFVSLTNKAAIPVIGLRVEAKASNGSAALLKGTNIGAGVGVNGFIGVRPEKGQSIIALKWGWGHDQLTLFNPKKTYADQLEKKSFESWELGLNYSLTASHVWLFGLAVGARRLNNYDNLDQVKVVDTKSTLDSVTTTTRSWAKETQARTGAYFSGVSAFIDLDIGRKFGSFPIGARALVRSLPATESKLRHTDVGIDLAALRGQDMTKRVLGLLVQLSDVFDEGGSNKKIPDRLGISLAVQLPFKGFFTP